MPTKKIRYGVIGLGHIAQVAVLPAFRHAKKNSELVALVTGDPLKAKKLSRKYRVPHVFGYEEYGSLLKSGLIDVMYIALPNSMHVNYAVQALEAGVHVLCEKPLALTLADTRRMQRASEKSGAKLMTAYRLHFEASNLKAIELCRSGKLGDLRYFSSNFSYSIKHQDNIRLQKDVGGGPVWDIGTYCINAARNIFGAEPTEVSAYAHKGSDERFKEVEEGMSVVMKFPDDRFATFNCSFGASAMANYEVVGTKASLRLENAYEYVAPRKLILQMENRKKVFNYKKCDQFAPELVYFSDCVLKDKMPEPSGLEGQGDVNAILAIYRSAAEGRPVRLTVSKDVQQKARPTKKMRMYRPGIKKVETIHAPAES